MERENMSDHTHTLSFSECSFCLTMISRVWEEPEWGDWLDLVRQAWLDTGSIAFLSL